MNIRDHALRERKYLLRTLGIIKEKGLLGCMEEGNLSERRMDEFAQRLKHYCNNNPVEGEELVGVYSSLVLRDFNRIVPGVGLKMQKY